MNFKQSFKIAAKSIVAKKGRSALTMLGIIIGLAAVIILVSFAKGQNKWMEDYYASMGDNTIDINAWTWDGRDVSEKLYNYCQEMDEYILGVTPMSEVYGDIVIQAGTTTITQNNTDWESQPQIYLGNQQFSLCAGYTIEKGRDLTYLDTENLNQVCVLGSKTAKLLFNFADPIGETVTISGIPLTVVGVFQEIDPDNFSGKDRVILLPYTLKRNLAALELGMNNDRFVAKARDARSTTMAISLLNGYLKGLVGENGHGYAQSPNEWKEESQDANRMQQLFLGGIAAISLLVGGIGIMNIMLVTVTERTREIGIRKAIGAERKSIIVQFLIEACLICGLGGLIGIAIGYLGTLVVCKLVLKFIYWPSIDITLASFAFSVAMGVIFGLYPAVKASGLQPVEALRAD